MPIERDAGQDEAKTIDGSSITLKSDTNAVAGVRSLVTRSGVASTPKDSCDVVGDSDEYWAVTDDKRLVSQLVSLPRRVIVGHDNWYVQYVRSDGRAAGAGNNARSYQTPPFCRLYRKSYKGRRFPLFNSNITNNTRSDQGTQYTSLV